MDVGVARTIGTIVTALALTGIASPTALVAQDDELPATLGASVPEFVDSFDEEGLWGLPDVHGSTVYSDGTIEMRYEQQGWMWGWRELTGSHHPVLRVQGTLAIADPGVSGGWMCGSLSGSFGFGVIDQGGDWGIGQVIDGEVTVRATGRVPADLREGDATGTLVDVECGQVNVDVTQVLLSVSGVPVGVASIAAIGTFGRAAFVGASLDGETGTIRFDEAAVWSGPVYAPSDQPGPTAGPIETAIPVDSVLGADTIAFEDDFSTPDLWGTGASAQGIVSYADEQLAITVLDEGASRWSWRAVDEPASVLRVEGAVRIHEDGSAGWMCGDDAEDPSFLFGVTGDSGSWTVGQLVGGEFSVMEQGTVAAGPPGDAARHVVLECGDTTDGGSRLLLWVDGEQLADVMVDDPRGPFQKATAFAGSGSPLPFNARFDDVIVSVGTEEAPPS
jgi:hypothetical protein